MMTISKRFNLFKKTYNQRRRVNPNSRSQLTHETLEKRHLLNGDNPFFNPLFPTDVNSDGYSTPQDVLFIVNEINKNGSRLLQPGEKVNGLVDANNDGFVTANDVLMVVNYVNQFHFEAEDDPPIVTIELQVTDTAGNDITSLGADQDFLLTAIVQDVTGRGEDSGTFAAYLDVTYDPSLVTVTGEVMHGPDFGRFPFDNVLSTDGVLDEIGSTSDNLFDPFGPDPQVLFTVPFRTLSSSGTVTFDAEGPDAPGPQNDILVHGETEGLNEDGSVPFERVMFVDDTLEIIGAATTPIAVNDAYEVDENSVLEITDVGQGVLLNDSDPNQDPLTAVLQDGTSNGSISLNSDGTFTYTPNVDFEGTDLFTYVANDGNEDSNAATVTITVNPVNAVPVANDDDYSIDEDTTLNGTVNVLDNDSDDDGDTLNATLVSNVSDGTLTLNSDGSFSYLPDPDFNGQDSFTYMANDGLADSNEATVSITVNPINDAPIAVDDESYSTAQGTPLSIAAELGVLINDLDVDGDSLTASLMDGPANGSVTLGADGSFMYTPNAEFNGNDTFTYVASDGTLESNPATVTINVEGESLVQVRLAATNLNGDPISQISPGGQFNVTVFTTDVGPIRDGVFALYTDIMFDSGLVSADQVSFDDSFPNGRMFTINQTAGMVEDVGAFIKEPIGGDPVPGPDEQTVFTITFTATNQGTAVFQSNEVDEPTTPATDILLLGLNEAIPTDRVDFGSTSIAIVQGNPPVAMADSYETDEDVLLVVSAVDGVLSNDTDPDGDILTANLMQTTSNGTLELNSDGSFIYTPNSNYFGTDSFIYRATDGGNESDDTTVTITVAPIDDAPIAVNDMYTLDDANSTLEVSAEDGVLSNDRDVDSAALTAALVTGPSNGTLTFNADGSFSYTPNSNAVDEDSFTYQATAGGLNSNIGTVVIQIGDASPSRIGGTVFVDANFDGVQGDREVTLGGVTVRLDGKNFRGEDVHLTVKTAADGSYMFQDNQLLRGAYTVTQVQPIFMIDGKDIHDGELSLRNDRFAINIDAGVTDLGYNFSERGLEPQFLGNANFFASRNPSGMFAAIDASGDQAWFSFEDGWRGLVDVHVSVSADRSNIELTGSSSTGSVGPQNISTANNRDVKIWGNMQQGMLVHLEGTASEFGLHTGVEAELDEDVVDSIFAA